MSNPGVVLCAAVRTAIGGYGGALKDVPATDLGAMAIREVLSRAYLNGDDIDTVVMGQVVQAGAKMNPARQAAMAAGIADDALLAEEIEGAVDGALVEGRCYLLHRCGDGFGGDVTAEAADGVKN